MIKKIEDVFRILEEIKKGKELEFEFNNDIWGKSYYRVFFQDGVFKTYWFNLKGNESIRATSRDEKEIKKFIWFFRKDINKSGEFFKRVD